MHKKPEIRTRRISGFFSLWFMESKCELDQQP